MQNVVWKSNERKWGLIELPYLLIRFCLFFLLLFNFFDIVSFVAKNLNKRHFQSQRRPSQINVVDLIGLKFKLFAIEKVGYIFCSGDDKASSTTGLFVLDFEKRPQNFGSEIILTWLVRNVCINSTHRSTGWFRRFSWRDSAGSFFCCHYPTAFSEFVFPHSLKLSWVFFPPLTTSAIPGTVYSNKSALTHFAAGTTFLNKSGVEVFPTTCASAQNPRPLCRPISLMNGISTCLEATIL